jgi:hypothetical protein
MAHQRSHRRPPKAMLLPLAAIGVTAAVRQRRRRAAVRRSDSGTTDVGYMRAMHDALRRDMIELASTARGADADSGTLSAFEDEWHQLRARLERHHSAEDDDLWPLLRRELHATEDLREIDRMIEEHRALSSAIADVDRALSTGFNAVPSVTELARLLRDHLEHEERSVLPPLAEHLSPEEWRRFLITERRRTPLRDRPDFLGWVLDDANDADTAAVMHELPPPGRFVYRHVIRPRYDAKHHQRSDRAVRTGQR